MRTCIGCRRRAEVADGLVRVVRGPDGGLALDRTAPGRGAWLCAGSTACLDLAAKRNAFSRALRAPVDALAVTALSANWPERARIEG